MICWVWLDGGVGGFFGVGRVGFETRLFIALIVESSTDPTLTELIEALSFPRVC